MKHTAQITQNQNSIEQVRHKKLNEDQINVLQLLYRFRFATSKQIALYQEKQSNKLIQRRLKILEDQDLISKRYDKTYKLQGKPAAYYLRPKGVRILETHISLKPDEPIDLRRIYRDKDVSENFIEHCLNILQTFLLLKQPHAEMKSFRYFTKSHLNYDKYEHFPKPQLDAYIRLETTKNELQFFLDIFESTQPYFILVRRIKYYFRYAEAGDWGAATNTNLPIILIACATTSVQKRVRRRIVKELRDSYEILTFATTTIDQLKNTESDTAIWLPIDEDGDNPYEPWMTTALHDF